MDIEVSTYSLITDTRTQSVGDTHTFAPNSHAQLHIIILYITHDTKPHAAAHTILPRTTRNHMYPTVCSHPQPPPPTVIVDLPAPPPTHKLVLIGNSVCTSGLLCILPVYCAPTPHSAPERRHDSCRMPHLAIILAKYRHLCTLIEVKTTITFHSVLFSSHNPECARFVSPSPRASRILLSPPRLPRRLYCHVRPRILPLRRLPSDVPLPGAICRPYL